MHVRAATVVVTPPAAGDPVITTAEAKLHLRVQHSTEDTLIAALVAAATDAAQTELRRQLVTATFDLLLDGFPLCIELPHGPATVTSISYYDDANVQQTLASANYVADVASKPGRITLADGYTWPTTYSRPNAVQVRFTAGYGAASAVPSGIKAWMLLRIGALYRHREEFVAGVSISELPGGFADRLLDPYRILLA